MSKIDELNNKIKKIIDKVIIHSSHEFLDEIVIKSIKFNEIVQNETNPIIDTIVPLPTGIHMDWFNNGLWGPYAPKDSTTEEPKKEQTNTEKKECYHWEHQYVNVGFHFDKWVCKVCNKEKPNDN
jgi:hypothetical protein